jgi:hypothetical protein
MSDLITLPAGELSTLDLELETARGLALEEIAASTRDCYRPDGRLFATGAPGATDQPQAGRDRLHAPDRR